MNILMFVLAMMMILGMMTYSKMNQFRTHFIIKTQFENYMQLIEHKYVNEKNTLLYEQTHIPKSEKKEQGTKNTNTSKLPISILLELSSSKSKEDYQESYQSIKSLLKQLIRNLYSQQPFFVEIQNKRPDFIEEIIISLPSALKKLKESQTLKRAKDLANLDLQDPVLNKVFYQMLKGLEIPEQKGKSYGYLPLTMFLDVKKNKKMRVYLLPKKLLEVIFNESIAEEIIQTREYLFAELLKENIDEKIATEKFEALFESHHNPIVSDKLLDFSVTLTDPKKYR